MKVPRAARSEPVIDVVLVGAGHAHVAVLRSFSMKPSSMVRLTLVTREVGSPCSGMLPDLAPGSTTSTGPIWTPGR